MLCVPLKGANQEEDENAMEENTKDREGVKQIPSKLENSFAMLTDRWADRLPERISPNQIIAAGLITGLLGAVCFVLGGRVRWFFLGAILGVVCHLIADNSDGFAVPLYGIYCSIALHSIYLINVFPFQGWGRLITFGNYGLSQQRKGTVDAAGMIAQGQDPSEIILTLIRTLPGYNIALALVIVTMIALYASTFDALTIVISAYSLKRLDADAEPGKWLRAYWSVLFILLPIGLIFSEKTPSAPFPYT